MNDTAAGIIIIIAIICAVAMLLAKAVHDDSRQSFEVACSAVNGKTIWNGRNWECLK